MYRIDAFIAGAEKAGTTSLGYYLGQHPQVHSHFSRGTYRVLEFSSFIDGGWNNRNIFRQDYLTAFGRLPEDGELVLAKNVDIMNNREGALNLRECSPDCKIILVLRNPIDRAYSSFWYQRYRGEEVFDKFEDAIALELEGGISSHLSPHRKYLERGHYAEHLHILYDIFAPENIHIVLFDDLKTTPKVVVNQLFEFLGVTPCFVDVDTVQNKAKAPRWPLVAQIVQRNGFIKSVVRLVLGRNVRRTVRQWISRVNSYENKPPQMSFETRTMLVEYFKPYNANLGDLLRLDLQHWNS